MFAESEETRGMAKMITRLAGYALVIFGVSLCAQNTHAESTQPDDTSSNSQQITQESRSNFEAIYRTRTWSVTKQKTREGKSNI